MGINQRFGGLDIFLQVVQEEALIIPGLRMAELGNQIIRKDMLGYNVPAKKVFEAFGVKHTSFDWNGKDGARPLDLSKPLPTKFCGQFDMVTNFGTSEHVHDQYHVWRNIDALCRLDGMMLHIIPERGSWVKHSKYHYTLDGLGALASVCSYGVTALRVNQAVQGQHVVVAAFKKTLTHFISESVFHLAIGSLDG